MLRLFQSSNPFTIFIYFIFTALLHLHLFLSPQQFTTQYDTLLCDWLFNQLFHLHELPFWLIASIHVLIVGLTGLSLSLLIQKHKLIQKVFLIPGAVFVLIMSWFPEMPLLSPELIAGLILTLLLFRIFNTYNKTKIDSLLFDTGMISAVISLIYYPAIVFSLFAILAIFRLRSTSAREFLVFFSGLLVIYFLVFTIAFWFDLLPSFSEKIYFPLALPSFDKLNDTVLIIQFILLGAVLLLSLWHLNEKYSGNLVQVRKYYGSFINLFIFSILILFFAPAVNVVHFQFLFIPVACFISYYLTKSGNNLTAELIFMSMTAAAFIFQYLTFAS